MIQNNQDLFEELHFNGFVLFPIDKNNKIVNHCLNEIKNVSLEKIKEGEFTDIIQVSNNYLILKIDEIKINEIKIDKQKEIEKLIRSETNKQLNQFSRIFFDKAKINYSINEK